MVVDQVGNSIYEPVRPQNEQSTKEDIVGTCARTWAVRQDTRLRYESTGGQTLSELLPCISAFARAARGGLEPPTFPMVRKTERNQWGPHTSNAFDSPNKAERQEIVCRPPDLCIRSITSRYLPRT